MRSHETRGCLKYRYELQMDNSHRMKYDNHTTCETSSPSLTVFLKVHARLKLTFLRTPGRIHSSRLNIQPSPVKGRWLSTLEVKNVASWWTFHFNRPKWKHLARKPRNTLQFWVLYHHRSSYWIRFGRNKVLMSSFSSVELRSHNRVICATMSGCYLYLFGVEYRLQQQQKILACWTATMTTGLIGVRLCAAKFSRVWDLTASVSTLTQRGLRRD